MFQRNQITKVGLTSLSGLNESGDSNAISIAAVFLKWKSFKEEARWGSWCTSGIRAVDFETFTYIIDLSVGGDGEEQGED